MQRAPRRWAQAARRCVMHRVVGALLGTTGRVSRGLSNAVRVCAVAMRSLTRNIGVWEVHARACSVLRRCVRALHCWLYCQRQHVRIKQSPHVTNETSDGVPKRCDDSLFLDGDNECERCDENTCAARFDAATCLSCGSGRYLSGESRMLNDVLDQVCDIKQHRVLCLRFIQAQHGKSVVPVERDAYTLRGANAARVYAL